MGSAPIALAAGGRLALAGSGSSVAGSFVPAVAAFEDWTPEGGAPAPVVQDLIGSGAIAAGIEGSPYATIDAPAGDEDALVLQQLSPVGPPPLTVCEIHRQCSGPFRPA